jgi:hypothetical protein
MPDIVTPNQVAAFIDRLIDHLIDEKNGSAGMLKETSHE